VNASPRRLRRRFAISIGIGGVLVSGAWAAASVTGGGFGGAEVVERIPAGLDPGVAAFHAGREDRLLWIGPDGLNAAGRRAADVLAGARDQGLKAADYMTPHLQARLEALPQDRSLASRAELDAVLSDAFVRFVTDLHRPRAQNNPLWVAGAAPERTDGASVLGLVERQGGASGVDAAVRMHPEYEALSRAIAVWRRDWGGLAALDLADGPTVRPGERDDRIPALRAILQPGAPAPAVPEAADRLDAGLSNRLTSYQRWHGLEATGALDAASIQSLRAGPPAFERRLAENLDRLRSLPAAPPAKSIVVNAAEAVLTAYENRRPVRRMRVIVGRPETPTPMMAGLVRYAVLDPYWNIPQDIVRAKVARTAVSDGGRDFRSRRLEVLADWSPSARKLAFTSVDWRAVAAGRQRVRLRQAPGPDNAMGRVKFMFPNDLGVYLHDTPDRALFTAPARTLSAGCVRLEDAAWLADWLVGIRLAEAGAGAPDRIVALERPAPVVIVYQTLRARPDGGFVAFRDVYGRDRTE
jgi:murein L,D-transpeptidase YcbB/YkuD